MHVCIRDLHYHCTDSGVAVLCVDSLDGLSQLRALKRHPQESERDGYGCAHAHRGDNLLAREVHQRDHNDKAAGATAECLDYHGPPALREDAVLVERHEVVDGDGIAKFHECLCSFA